MIPNEKEMERTLDSTLKIIRRKTPTVAKIYRELFDELQKQGFNEETANMICINHSLSLT